jgi:LuxR family maltose regulon positive regulatory protein
MLAEGDDRRLHAPPLAETKLAAPRPRPDTIARPRILRSLDAGNAGSLTLVAAPPGYGKTTAVRDWCASSGAALAWVTLDARDNDPVRLWRYVATAFDRIREGLGRSALQRLEIPGGAIDGVIDDLMNGIAAFDSPVALVLDDLHTVTDAECLSWLAYAIERIPPFARLVAITRADPGLPLGKLRARGALTELRADQLAFTSSETRELLAKRGFELGGDEVDLLRTRADGWPAALFLAALWLETVDDVGDAVRAFGGDHRFVAEYLANEVIAALDEDTRSFLLRTCVLGSLTAELCDGVLERTDSASRLAALDRSNLFVTRLAHGGWYRVHPLFAEFARFQLASIEPGAAVEIHRRASVWLAGRGHVIEAAQHASDAEDHALVAELLVGYHLALIRNGHARTLLDWVRTLPDEQIVAHPELAVGAATAATMLGHAAHERRRFLGLARRAQSEHPEAFTPYVEATEAMVRAAALDDGVAAAVDQGRRATAAAETGGDEVLVAARGSYARALYFAGRLDDAWAVGLQAVGHPDAARRAPGHAYAQSTLALVALEQGRAGAARAHAERAKALTGGAGSSRSWLGANASVAIGCVLAAEGKLVDAERELVAAERFFRDEVPSLYHAWALALLASVRCRRGRLDEAAAAARQARDTVLELADAGTIGTMVAAAEHELEQARVRAARNGAAARPSQAELSVLRLLGSELSIREIGGELFLSPNTVRSHTRAIYRKLGVHSRGDAVARAEALGFLPNAESPM